MAKKSNKGVNNSPQHKGGGGSSHAGASGVGAQSGAGNSKKKPKAA